MPRKRQDRGQRQDRQQRSRQQRGKPKRSAATNDRTSPDRVDEPSFANTNIAVTQHEEAVRRLERAETGRDIWERVEGEQEGRRQQPDSGEEG